MAIYKIGGILLRHFYIVFSVLRQS